MEKVYGIPEGIVDMKTGFCAGCTHPTAAKLVAEVLNELQILGKTVIHMPIGCALHATPYFDVDQVQCLHGRAAAVATGFTRMNPDKVTMTYQGDGDASSIGFAETFYAANRGEKMTIIMINNQVYGMTGGQQSPTTLVGQRTTTGTRVIERAGYPVRMAEVLAPLEAPGYVARGALHTTRHILQAKGFIKKALQCQLDTNRFSFVELVSLCPTNWGIAPRDCVQYVEDNVLPIFPIGEKKTLEGV